MSKQIATVDFIRKRYEKLNAYYGAKGLAAQPSVIRIETPFVNGKGVYEFNIKKEILGPSENGLKRNDLFSTVAIGLATIVEDLDKPGTGLLDFSPRIGVGVDNSGSISLLSPGFATEDVKALYNGTLYVATANTVNITDMPTAVFLRQQSDDVTKTSTGGAAFAPNEIRSKKFNFEDDLVTLAPELVFAGTQDHVIKVSFPTFGTANYEALQATTSGTPTTNWQARLALVIYGFRVIGGTSQTYKDDKDNPFRFCI